MCVECIHVGVMFNYITVHVLCCRFINDDNLSKFTLLIHLADRHDKEGHNKGTPVVITFFTP